MLALSLRVLISIFHFYLVDNLRNDFLARHVGSLCLVRQADAMAQHVVGNGTHILGHHIAAALDECIGAGCLGQVDGGTRRTAEGDEVLQLGKSVAVGIARSENDVGDILLNLLVKIYLAHHFAGVDNLLSRADGTNGGQSAHDVLADNLLLLFERGIVDDHLQHETVHLGLGQRIGSLLLDGVLGGHHEERTGKGKCVAANRHLMFLHSLEQSTLHLGRGTVDFIGQHEVGKHRTVLHLEVFVLLRVDHRTDNVGRQQIGSELNSAEIGIDELCQRLDGQRLCQSGHTFQKDVTVAEERDEE